MAIDHKAAEAAKPRDKVHYLSDGKQLRLQIHPKGGKYWQRGYRLPSGKQSVFSLGVFPDVTVKTARAKAAVVSGLVGEGKDPSEFEIVMGKAGWVAQAKPTAAEIAKIKSADITLSDYAEKWMEKKTQGKGGKSWNLETKGKREQSLQKWVFKYLGDKPLSEITKPELIQVFERVAAADALDILGKMLTAIREMFDDAEEEELVEFNPTPKRSKFASREHTQFVMLDFEDRAKFLKAVDDYPESKFHKSIRATKLCIKLSMILMVRPVEIRTSEWSEFNLDEHLWEVPPQKMKKVRAHVVPLPEQAVALLKELQQIEYKLGPSRYLFPMVRDPNQPMSDNTVGKLLRNIGFKGITDVDHSKTENITAHGFRHMASTHLYEEEGKQKDDIKYNGLAIEKQLAHSDGNKVRGAYNKAQYLPIRQKMIQDFADRVMPRESVSQSNPESHQSASA